MVKEKTYWKSLKLQDGKIVSEFDKSEWQIGEWRTVCTPTEDCKGLNACENIIDAINYVTPDVLAEVEVSGECIESDDKITCERMRIIRVWKWEKEDSVALAIFAARLCLHNFESKYPDDDHPRKAIEAAEAYQQNPTDESESAARSAARSAAESAAESAMWSARSAMSAMWSAAESAARSAMWSAMSAMWSARSAARSTTKEKLHNFVVQRFAEREPIVVVG